MKNKILSPLIYIFTTATLIGLIYFQNDLYKVAFVAGLGATIVGILSAINKNNYGYLIISPGISLFTSTILYKFSILDKSDCVTYVICLSIFILMSITLIINILGQNKVKKVYDKVVEAKVTDLVKNPNTKKEYYQVIYEYNIDKNIYTVGTPDFINKFIPKIGDKLNLRINSKDYTDVFFDKRPLDKLYENGLVIGLIIVTFIIVVSLFI